MQRLEQCFAALAANKRKAFIPFITAGDPDETTTEACLDALVAGGANIIELGVPFSDPMADGPTIQRASERALAAGMSLTKVLQLAQRFRSRHARVPVVLMGYANPIEAMGVENFIAAAVAAGIDGVLVVDYPPEEATDFAAHLKKSGIAPIFLLAPTSTPERITQVANLGAGYVYYVSLKGVTGSVSLDIGAVGQMVPEIRKQVGMPVGVGFGIRDAASAQAISRFADAVVIGSRIIEEIENTTTDKAAERVREFALGIRQALDTGKV